MILSVDGTMPMAIIWLMDPPEGLISTITASRSYLTTSLFTRVVKKPANGYPFFCLSSSPKPTMAPMRSASMLFQATLSLPVWCGICVGDEICERQEKRTDHSRAVDCPSSPVILFEPHSETQLLISCSQDSRLRKRSKRWTMPRGLETNASMPRG